jgi:anti-sigma B factor antagonist
MADLTVPVPFSCAVVPRRQSVHVCPVGELDMTTTPEVDARLAELHLAGFERIVLDLRGLTFMDSGGVRLMLQWTGRASDEGFAFSVLGGDDAVQRVLALTGAQPRLHFAAAGSTGW